MLVPILGLMAIVLYGTTRASKPPSLSESPATAETPLAGYVEMEPSQPLQRAEAPPPPPPAPRLQSDIEEEEEAARLATIERAARAREAAADTTARAVLVPEGDYIPTPIVVDP